MIKSYLYHVLIFGALMLLAIANAQDARKPVPLVAIDLQAKYYKEWGELQSKMGQFQASLTAQQKALQDDIRARTEVVNRVKDEINAKACDGSLNVIKLMQENIIECKSTDPGEGVKP